MNLLFAIFYNNESDIYHSKPIPIITTLCVMVNKSLMLSTAKKGKAIKMNYYNKLKNEYYEYRNSQNCILHYKDIPLQSNSVNIHYYHSEKEKIPYDYNLGDFLSTIILKYMLNLYDVDPFKKVNQTKNLYTVGSIIFMGYQNATIWGSGCPYEPYFYKSFFHRSKFRHLDIRSVRGPLTRKILVKLGHKCPEIYGDPAIILPKIYKPKEKKTNDYLLIPHFEVEKKYNNSVNKCNMLSMNTCDYKSVISKICSSKKVISSSLHGIILAEAYGVPAVFLQDRSQKLDIKYRDWYESTNRTFTFANTVEEALSMKIELPSNLDKLCNDVINAFPYDIWK